MTGLGIGGGCRTGNAGRRQRGHALVVLTKAPPAGRRLALLGGCALSMATWLCLTPPARADTVEWNDPGASGNWNDGTNWQGGTVPAVGDDAYIDATGVTVTISGTQESIHDLALASSADSSLTIENGGSLNLRFGSIGTGTLTVTGSGSALTLSEDLVFGRGVGQTFVLVEDGAHVSAGRTWIGEEPTPFASNTGIEVTLRGPGTQWDAGSNLVVGGVTGNPATSLDIGQGAVMTTTGDAQIGYGAEATVTVTDAGSKLTVGGGLYLGVRREPAPNALGGDGNGTLTIDNGGEVDAAAGVLLGRDGAAASGTLNLNGTGAQGILQTALLSKGLGDAQVNFNGGLLRASAGGVFISGFDPGDLDIQAGDAFIDSNGFNLIAASAFSGIGALVKQGDGRLALTADNTYAGGTTVEGGVLAIGAGGTTGSVLGDIAVQAPALLAFNRSDDIVYGDVISGLGGMVQEGPGRLTLTGISSYTGGTTVAAGTLMVGDSANPTAAIIGDTTVDGGATLAGFGTVGSIANNGVVLGGDPDGSIGVLRATGNYEQGAGGTLLTHVTQPAASRVEVAGTAKLGGQAAFSYAAGAYAPGIYPILTSGGGVSGAFSGVSESGAIPFNLVRRVTYSTSVVNLVLSLPTQSDTGSETVIFPDSSGTAQRNTQLATSYLLDEVAAKCAASDRTCVWMNPLGHFANFDGSNGTPGFTSDTGGFMAGAHRQISDNMLLGIGGGYEYTGITAGSSTANIQTARVFAYGNIDLAPVVISGTMGYAHDWLETTRNNADGIVGGDGAKQSHQASEYSAGIQVALPTRIGPVELRPKAGLQYALIDEDSFDEDGAAPLDLHGDKNRHSSLRSFIGLNVSQEIAIDRLTLVPGLDLGYARELLDESQAGKLSLDNGDDFRPGDPVAARNIVTAGAGIDLISLDGVNIGAKYGASIYLGDGVDHTVRLKGEWTF